MTDPFRIDPDKTSPTPEQSGETLATVHAIHPQEEGVFSTMATLHGQVRVLGCNVEFTRESPLDQLIEEKVLIVPGFGGFKRTSRGLRGAFAEAGYDATSYSPVRRDRQSRRDQLVYPQQVHVETIRMLSQEILEEPDEKLTLVAHSMGGLAAVGYAKNHPDKVNNLLLVGSAGFHSPRLLQLASSLPRGLAGSLRHEFIPMIRQKAVDATPLNAWRAAYHYLANPTRTAGEAISCISQDVRDDVRELSEQGVRTIFLGLEYDMLVPVPDTAVCDESAILPRAGHIAPQVKADRIATWYSHFRQAQT